MHMVDKYIYLWILKKFLKNEGACLSLCACARELFLYSEMFNSVLLINTGCYYRGNSKQWLILPIFFLTFSYAKQLRTQEAIYDAKPLTWTGAENIKFVWCLPTFSAMRTCSVGQIPVSNWEVITERVCKAFINCRCDSEKQPIFFFLYFSKYILNSFIIPQYFHCLTAPFMHA